MWETPWQRRTLYTQKVYAEFNRRFNKHFGGKKFANYCIEKPQQKIPWLKIVRRWETISMDMFPNFAPL